MRKVPTAVVAVPLDDDMALFELSAATALRALRGRADVWSRTFRGRGSCGGFTPDGGYLVRANSNGAVYLLLRMERSSQ